MLTENLQRVRERMQRACAHVGRDPASLLLVGVTKGRTAEQVREALACGLTELGENRVQEAQEKITALSGASARWHLIGHLQRNKVKRAVELFQVIQSVDSFALAEALEKQMDARAQDILEVFVQVNVSGEATKFGCTPDEAPMLAQHVAALPHLRVRGFMTIAPLVDDPESARPIFRRLRELRDTVNGAFQLSMGMSHDFDVAIEEGADCIRVGTALFGA